MIISPHLSLNHNICENILDVERGKSPLSVYKHGHHLFYFVFHSLLWNRAQINNKTRKITVQLLIIDGFGFKLQGHTCPHLINLYVTSCKIVL